MYNGCGEQTGGQGWIEFLEIIFQPEGVCACVFEWVWVWVFVAHMCVFFLKARAYYKNLEEIVQHRQQNICCQGSENMNIYLVITPVTHCVIFDKSHNLSVTQGPPILTQIR